MEQDPFPQTQTNKNAYDVLGEWPGQRPSWIFHKIDYRTKSVYITDAGGNPILVYPFESWLKVANELPANPSTEQTN